LAFLAQNKAKLPKILIITLVFETNAIFCRKLPKIAENCDHNIDPCFGQGLPGREQGLLSRTGLHLILVEFAVLVRRLSLVLEGDDNETDEDVDHEEGDDDDVDEVEDGNDGTVVVQRATVLLVGVDGDVQDAETSNVYENTWDRCYDFLNILAENFGKKWRFLLKTKLNYAKI
jgi:hypothetical protein